MEEMICWTAKS